MNREEQPARLRLDKWLWAARFFKTRQLAVDAINGGKVHLNGKRTKPGKEVQPGSRLSIHKGSLAWEIEVLQIPKQRRPASEAVHFYHEEEASRERRQQLIEERRVMRNDQATSATRPTKRDRRMIRRFTHSEE